MGSRTFLVTTVSVIALLVFGGLGAYFLMRENQTPHAEHSVEKSETDTPEQTATPDVTEPMTKQLKIYHIALEDEGTSGERIGCGDSLVPVDTEPVTSTDLLKEAMTRLLKADQYYGESGLYNAVYQSDLTYKDGKTVETMVTVELTGQIRQNGECDAPRIQAQLEQTAKDATGATTANITVDGRPLGDVLSLR